MNAPARIYLDHNATTRPFDAVIDVVAAAYREAFANPGSRHAEGRQARRVLEAARESLAARLDCLPEEIVFTSGGTEASNMAILGLTTGKPGTIVITPGEHPATIESSRHLQSKGWTLLELPLDTDGRIVDAQLDSLPWNEIRLVSLLYAHNETGVIQDVSRLSALCLANGVPLHLDAVQAVGKILVRFHELGAMCLSLGAHKFHGPRGVGALLVRKGLRLSPTQFGGHQEQGRRPGTEAVPLIAGMAKALELCTDDLDRRMRDMTSLRDRLQAGLEQTCAPIVVNGSIAHRLPNTLNVSFPGADGEALLVALDLAGIACSLGSTCASGSSEPAPILVAMGKPPEVYRSAVRFSVGESNSPKQIDDAVARIAEVVRRLRSNSTTA